MAIVIFLTSKPSLLLLNLNEEPRFIFSPYQIYDTWKYVIEKKENYSAIVAYLFLLQIYTEW